MTRHRNAIRVSEIGAATVMHRPVHAVLSVEVPGVRCDGLQALLTGVGGHFCSLVADR